MLKWMTSTVIGTAVPYWQLHIRAMRKSYGFESTKELMRITQAGNAVQCNTSCYGSRPRQDPQDSLFHQRKRKCAGFTSRLFN